MKINPITTRIAAHLRPMRPKPNEPFVWVVSGLVYVRGETPAHYVSSFSENGNLNALWIKASGFQRKNNWKGELSAQGEVSDSSKISFDLTDIELGKIARDKAQADANDRKDKENARNAWLAKPEIALASSIYSRTNDLRHDEFCQKMASLPPEVMESILNVLK